MTYSFLNFEGKQIIMRKKCLRRKIALPEWKTHWIWDPKIASLNLSASDIFFLRVWFRFLFIMLSLKMFVHLFIRFFLTFVKFFKTLMEKKLWCQKKFLRRKVENSILIKERFSKLNFYISERMHRISYFSTLTTM